MFYRISGLNCALTNANHSASGESKLRQVSFLTNGYSTSPAESLTVALKVSVEGF